MDYTLSFSTHRRKDGIGAKKIDFSGRLTDIRSGLKVQASQLPSAEMTGQYLVLSTKFSVT